MMGNFKFKKRRSYSILQSFSALIKKQTFFNFYLCLFMILILIFFYFAFFTGSNSIIFVAIKRYNKIFKVLLNLLYFLFFFILLT